MSESDYSNDEEIVKKLVALYNNWGDTLVTTIEKCNDISTYKYRNHVDNIRKIRRENNINKYKHNNYYKKEEHLSELRKKEALGNKVTSDDIKYKLFDSDKSANEIREMAGLNFTSSSLREKSEVYMIEQISSIDSDVIYAKDIDNKTEFSSNEYWYQFGSLANAIELAGKYKPDNYSEFWYQYTEIPDVNEAVESLDGYDKESNYYVYRLCFDNSYYVGMTNNIARRFIQANSRNRWPGDFPNNIDIEKYEDVDDANERERELTFETAIEFDTNNVYGGHKKYIN